MNFLTLLQNKNRCFNKFLEISQSFLEEVERNNFSNLDQFEKSRDSIIKAMELYDRKLKTNILNQPLTDECIEAYNQFLIDSEITLKSILTVDDKIACLIENEKNRLLEELHQSDRSIQAVKKFRSQWISDRGERLDGQI